MINQPVQYTANTKPTYFSTAGRHIPEQSMQINMRSEYLWLRLAGLAHGQQRLDCLQTALQINPNNKQTQRLIDRMVREG